MDHFALRPMVLMTAFASAAMLGAGMVSAQSVTASGYAELEFVRSGGSDETGLAAGLAFNAPAGSLGFGNIGLDADVRTLFVDGGDFYTVYLAPTFQIGPGTLSVGAPEPVLNDLYDGPVFGGIRRLDVLARPATGSTTDLLYFSDSINAPLGVRYDAAFGKLTFGASAHRLSGLDATALEVIARYPLGAVSLAGGIEVLDGSGDTESRFILGASADTGAWGGGLYYYDEAFTTGASGLRGFVTYEPSDNVDLNGSILTESGGDYTLGVSIGYSFGKAAFAQLGVVDGNQTDTAYDLSVGLKF